MNIFKTTEERKGQYSEYPYIHHLDSPVPVWPDFLHLYDFC